jgi:short-subunit dehydrogenase
MMPAAGLLLRHVAAAAAAACTTAVGASFFFMDCNPSLYWYDKLLASRPHSRSPAFAHKRIWIVGASSGIGEELAYQLAASGTDCLILSSRSQQRLQEVAAECQRRNTNPSSQVVVLPLDVTNHTALKEAVQQLHAESSDFVPLDIVFLNAGKGHLSPATQTDPDTVESVMQATAIWPMILTPLLLQQQSSVFGAANNNRKPHLVVTNSIAGKLAVPLSAVYAASKFALTGYFMSLQAERPDIRVDVLCPGPVDTAFHQNNHANQEEQDNKVNDTEAPLLPVERKISKLKMPVDRCVQLMLSAVQRKSETGHEAWIAPQPALSALYLQQWVPGLVSWILTKVGPKRVQMWEDGLDLYDPASWKKQQASAPTNMKAQAESKREETSQSQR